MCLGLSVGLDHEMDGATTEIYSAFSVKEEGTLSSFRGAQEIIEMNGLFSSLFTDRSSHHLWYMEAPKGGHVTIRLMQSHSPCSQWGPGSFPAYSPEARDRSAPSNPCRPVA